MRYFLCALVMFGGVGLTPAESLTGFDGASTETQRELEEHFDDRLDLEDQRTWLKHLSAYPHHAGSSAGRDNARYVAALFESWGYKVDVEEYEVLLPFPITRELELKEPHSFVASLTEDTLANDLGTANRDGVLPPYNAFSIDGEVESELVFVNYGIPEDYEVLERYNISLEGKIAIARYGRSWRGIKPKLAAEKGAIGTIIYSDPADDGYARGDVYPEGPFKHESAVQRGSVMDMPTYPGDVLTPGRAATSDAERLDRENAPTLTKIPVLPISQRDALPLLEALGGPVVPPEWRGALPITYHIGPGPAKIRLKVEFDWKTVTAYNVIARLDGSKYPDQWIIRGNHHDGWNHGAADPNSGLVAMLAEAQAIGGLAADGDPPARTIVYAAWDAEEPGLIGSTEWVEHHSRELAEHAVTYLNTDSNSRGFVWMGGSHTLEQFLNEVAADVTDPQTGVSVLQRRKAAMAVEAESEEEREQVARENLRLAPLGSGSDYTPFLQRLGVASAHLYFDGEGDGGSYHTLYDTYEHYTSWRDPGLVYGVALSKLAGRATLRLANAPLLPFEFEGLSDNVTRYIDELKELAEVMRAETERRNRLLKDGSYRLALDPTLSLGPPSYQPEVPYFNFAPLENAGRRLAEAAIAYNEALAGNARPSQTINELLYTSERLLILEAGLDGRPWYKHHVYAPGFYTGYDVKTIPAVREAIEQRKFAEVEPQVAIAAQVLHTMAERVELLTTMLQN